MSIIKQAKKEVVHAFPRAYATTQGVNEAVTLKWLARKTRKSKNPKNGKNWYYGTLTEITTRFPYLSRSSIGRAIETLETAGLVEISNYNRLKIDKTQWYHVPQPHRDEAEKDLIKFDRGVATAHSILAGVLVQNLRHHLREKRKKRKPLEQEMSAVVLNKALPFFSVSTIKRCLRELVKAKLVIRTKENEPVYTLPEFQKT